MFQGTARRIEPTARPSSSCTTSSGTNAAALGNHEWDWGRDSLRARMRQARFPILGANVRFADGRDVPWMPDDTLLTVGSLKVGVIGVTTVETPRTTMALNVADLAFPSPRSARERTSEGASRSWRRCGHRRGARRRVLPVANGRHNRRRVRRRDCRTRAWNHRARRRHCERPYAFAREHARERDPDRAGEVPRTRGRRGRRPVRRRHRHRGGAGRPLGFRRRRIAGVDSLVKRVVAAVAAEMSRPIARSPSHCAGPDANMRSATSSRTRSAPRGRETSPS